MAGSDPVKERLKLGKEEIKKRFFSDFNASASANEIAVLYDSVIHEIFSDIFKDEEVAVLGLGSYGRYCPSPNSDVDILMLVEDVSAINFETKLEKFIQMLWDLGFEVGHNFIDLKNWKNPALKDHIFLTNLQNARYIVGDKNLAHRFLENYSGFLNEYPLKKYLTGKMQLIDKVRKRYGGAFSLKEPDIKESPGGLRDYQLILWINQKMHGIHCIEELKDFGILDEDDIKIIQEKYRFILKTRFLLHYLSGKNRNLLNLTNQKEIAHILGYRDTANLTGVEQFMRDFYKAVKKIHYYSNLTIRLLTNPKTNKVIKLDKNFSAVNKIIYTTTPTVFKVDPRNFLRFFLYLQRHNYSPAHSTEKLIERDAHFIRKIREDITASELFDKIISHLDGLASALRYMHFSGMLDEYIPEFSRIDCLYQEEAHHQFTVDEHILRAIGKLEYLSHSRKKQDKFYKVILEKISDLRILVLAILLHDIGKSLGRGHAEKGAHLVPKILARLNYPTFIINTVTELVRKHLIMTNTFQMHDIENEDIIKDFALHVKTQEFLDYLTLLTYLDVSSVSETLWTAWKSAMLQMLYNNTANFLVKGALPLEEMREYTENIKKAVLSEYENTKYESVSKDFLNKVPRKYLLSYSIFQILYHIRIAYLSKGKDVFITHRYRRKTKSYMITVCASDQLRLFSKITGSLSFWGLNIVGADIFTQSVGAAVDTIYFTSRFQLTWYDWKEIKNMIRDVITGTLDLAEKFKAKQLNLIEPAAYEINFDNDLLRDYTIAYINARDRLALLYNITGSFSDLNLTIKYSKIMTAGRRAVDTFYFTNIKGKKVTSSVILGELKNKIAERLNDDIH